MNEIKIKTKFKTYPVFIGNSNFSKAFDFIKESGLNKNLFIVVDENVLKLHKDYIIEALRKADYNYFIYSLKSGEKSKSPAELQKILSSLIDNNFGRDSLLIAVGGGVTGDLAGFAASVFMRGIQLVHIPTTLLAAADSSIGGKTGVNFKSYKNIAGTFHQPEFVLIDTNFLSTLPEEEINSGAGELIKYAFLTDYNFFNYINKNFDKIYSFDNNVLKNIIYKSVLFKGSVTSKDEFEGGLRKILNFGHTFAHAYESLSGYLLRHGEAVAVGIISALFLSFKKGFLSESNLSKFLKLPLKVKSSMDFISKNYNSIIKFMHGDKKNREGEIRFILLQDIGRIISDVKVKESEIIYSIEKTKEILKENL